ncbi:MAG: TonB family protein [Phocaeicola sp.]
MALFFVYILKSAICLALFYLFYRLLLSNETFHKFNRMALLGLLVLSCLVPFMEVTTQQTTEVQQSLLTLEEWLLLAEYAAEGVVSTETIAASNHSLLSWREALLLIYWVGIFFFFLRALYSITKMLLLIKSGKRVKHQGSSLIIHNKEVAPFSWMRYIVLSEKDYDENGKEIITHEQAHIAKRHSWDLLVAEVCLFFQWFNPAAWLLKQELQNIHEYQADSSVLSQGIDAKQYQLLLIKKAVGPRLYSMANSFNHHSLKKRIAMMLKQKSSPWARAKFLYVLPLAAVAVAAFARPEVSNELNEISAVKVTNLTEKVATEVVKSSENPLNESFTFKAKLVDKESNKPVQGASVIVKGTHRGTMSDAEGRFTIDVAENEIIEVSFVGYGGLSIAGAKPNQEERTFTMTTIAVAMDEMRVVAYANPSNEGKAAPSKATPTKGSVDASSSPTEQDVPKKAAASGDEPVFMVVEQMPEYKGGMQECLKFLAMNMKYPAKAQEEKIQGRVIVQFVVSKEGTIRDVQVVRSIHEALDAEAIRVVSSMPAWNPGKQRGKAVDVRYTLPITFSLDGSGASGASAAAVNISSTSPGGDKMPKMIAAEGAQVVGQVYNSVDVMPSYEGGMKGALVYIGKEIKYPKQAQDEQAQGRVIVQFVVSKDGSLRDFNIVRGIHEALDAEAVRVLSSMPKWIPGKQDGEAVDVKFTLPIMFQLPADGESKSSSDLVVKQGIIPNMLYVIDGKVVASLEGISNDAIQSIEILKEDSANELLAKHNATDKSGVVVVTLKQ